MRRKWVFLLMLCLLVGALVFVWQRHAGSREAHARLLILELSYLKCDSEKPKVQDRIAFAASFSSPNSRTLNEVSEELAGMGEEVIPLLMAELSGDNLEQKFMCGNGVRVCYVLSRMGSPAVRPLLEKMEATPLEQLSTRECIANHLGIIGPAAREAIPALLEDLKSDVPLIRCLAALTLARIDHGLAVREALPIVLADARGDNLAQYASARALAIIGPVTPEAQEAINLLTPKWNTVLKY